MKLRLVPMLALYLSACAGAAPELPKDYGSVDARERVSLAAFDSVSQQLTCTEIDAELHALSVEVASAETDIAGKRGQNQVATYFGALFFLPALLATDSSSEAKGKLAQVNVAKDKLYRLRSAKKCPLASAS